MKARYTISILLLLLSFATDGKQKIFEFEYDGWGNLSKTVFEDGKSELCNPDKTGNLFESLDRLDRKYAQGGQLLKTADWEYKYDREGNLVRKKDKHGATWRYEWNEAGMLAKVKRPDSAEVSFKYDALGRRISKRFRNMITRWTWDGNVPLHEQKTQYWRDYEKDRGEFLREDKQPLVTWVFEEGTFVPVARITEKQQLSIVTNYLGTPEAMYREDGEAVWTCELNSYGKVRNFQGEFKTDCPFRYQGQYEDSETGLFYNRFRYYDADTGNYLSQDPIGLAGNNPTLYGYVIDINSWVDRFGLDSVQKSIDRHNKKQAKREPVSKPHQYENPGHHDTRNTPGKEPYIKGKDTLPSDAHEVYKTAVKVDDRTYIGYSHKTGEYYRYQEHHAHGSPNRKHGAVHFNGRTGKGYRGIPDDVLSKAKKKMKTCP